LAVTAAYRKALLNYDETGLKPELKAHEELIGEM